MYTKWFLLNKKAIISSVISKATVQIDMIRRITNYSEWDNPSIINPFGEASFYMSQRFIKNVVLPQLQ